MNTTEQQFSQLVRDNRSTIYAVCYMFSNDADEVADLFQKVLVKLWNGYESFHGKSDVKTWIYRVTLNTCITIDRKKRSRRKALLSMDVDYFNDEEKSTAQVRMLHERIARLQPLDRAIVLLWLEQISYDEIGDIVGLSAKNVSVRLARIRVQLKSMRLLRVLPRADHRRVVVRYQGVRPPFVAQLRLPHDYGYSKRHSRLSHQRFGCQRRRL